MILISDYILVLVLIWLESTSAIYTPNDKITKPPFVKTWRKVALQQHQMNSPIIVYHNYSRVSMHNTDFLPSEITETQRRNYTVHIIDTDAGEPETYSQQNVAFHEQQGSFSGNYDQVHVTNREQQGSQIVEQTYDGRIQPHTTQEKSYTFTSQTNNQYQPGLNHNIQNQRVIHDKVNQNIVVDGKLGSFSGSHDTQRQPKTYDFTNQQQTQHQFNEQYHASSNHDMQRQKMIHDKLAPINQNIQIDGKLGSFNRYQQGNINYSQNKPNYQVSTGRSNLPPPKDELEVFGYHYPPRPNEVYPFNKPPKPYSNMAFETCPKNFTGQLVYQWSCSQFLNCWKGRGFIQNCAPGTMFNPVTLECDFPHKVNCISGTHNHKVSSERLITSELQIEKICKPNFSGLLPYPKDCTKFINCANGQTFIQDCGPATAFNPTIQACDHRHNTGCNTKDEEDNTASYPYELTEQDTRTGRGHQNIASHQNQKESNVDQQGYYTQTNTGSGQYSQHWQTNNQKGNSHAGVIPGQNFQTGQTIEHSAGNVQYYNQQNRGQLPTLRDVHHQYVKGQRIPVSGTQTSVHSSGSNVQYLHNCSPGNCQIQQPLPSGYHTSTGTQTILSSRGENTQSTHGIHSTGQQTTSNQHGCTPSSCQGQTQHLTNQQGTIQGHYIRNYDQNIPNSGNTGQISTYNQHGYQQTNTGRGVARSSPFNATTGQVWYTNISSQNREHTSNNRQRNITQESTRAGRENKSNGPVNCPPGHNGLLPHPFICEKFLNCANGGTFIQDCGPGTVFNPDLKVCDWPYNLKCSSSTTQSSPRPTPVQPYSPRKPDVSQGTVYGGGHSTIYTQHGYNEQGQVQNQHVDRTRQTSQSDVSGHHSWQSARPTTTHGTSQFTGYTGQAASHIQGQSQVPIYYGQPTTKPTASSYTGPITQGQTPTVSSQVGTGHYIQISHTDQDQTTNKHFITSPSAPNYIYTGQTNLGNLPTSASHVNQEGTYTSQSGQGQINRQDGTYYTQSQVFTDQTREQRQEYPEQTIQGQTPVYTSGAIYSQSPSYNSGSHGHGYIHRTQTGQVQPVETSHHTHTTLCNHTSYGNLPANSQVQSSYGSPNQQPQSNYGTHFIEPEPGIHFSTGGPQQITASDQNKQGNFRPNTYGTNVGTQTLTTSVNVHESTNRKGSKHWPAPFPSTDTSADYYFEETTTSIPKGRTNDKTWKSVKQCSESQFQCSDLCILRSKVCDGYKDCPDGIDEQNCTHLQQFTMTPNHRLYKHEIEKWLNTNVQTCAGYCLNSKSFPCKSFNFKRENNVCLLCDTNLGLSGALTPSNQYDYYEISALSVNCTNMYECSNKKCINYTQVCDGHDDCGNRMDEKHCTAQSLGYEIKLTGSDFKNEGRIEIKVFDEWGYICDDQFGLRDADVACKELGFPQGAIEVKKGSHFAKDIKENETYYLMDDVSCFGNETSLRDCDFNGWGNHNCMPQEIVGVVCKTTDETCPKDHWKCDTTRECLPLQFVCDGVFDCADHSDEGTQHCEAPIEVRLVNGTSKKEGRIEVRYHGIWGTICDDDFNDLTAKVICKSLGYHGSAVAKKDAAFGAGEGPIWLDQVSCFGNETLLEDCSHWNWGEHNCEHNEDAGVVCSTLDTTEYEKKSKDFDVIHMELPNSPLTVDEIFSGKCGHRGDDLFFNEDDNDKSDVHFRVVQGSIAKKGEYPWQATIRVRGLSKSSHWCGAVIISNKYVLTAAHCLVGFPKGSYIIRAGDYNVDEHEGTEVEAYIEDYYIHERFRQDGHMNNDIALIRLKGAGLHLSKQVQPICLPNKNATYRHGMNCTISGFGSTETGKSSSSHILRAGWVSIQSQHVCKMPHVYGHSITDGMFCAGSLDEGVDSCDGDSGGPLACLDQGLFTLYGITSWGQRCGHANKPGVYVNISHYRDWIDKKIQESS